MCYLILVGRDAAEGGYVLGGHNDDLHGNTAAAYGLMPGGAHDAGEVVRLPRPWFCIGDVRIEESNGIELPQVSETYKCFALQTFRGYVAGDTSAMNERRVSVVGGMNLAVDRNDRAEEADPVNKGGLAGGVRYVALQRSRTARECVEKLGALLSEYGAVFPSCVGITDPNEAWYFEVGGGHTWAAVRVPDDCFFVQANGYRISEIDPLDTDNVVCSPGLLDLVREKGLWNPSDGPFHWARAFGGKFIANPDRRYYNLRRLWAAQNRYAPGAGLDPDLTELPMFLKPARKIGVTDVMAALRDRFEGTRFESFPEPRGKGGERPVCVPSCIHSAVIESRGNLPADIGMTLWGCIGSPMTSPYIPHYLAHRELLPAYTKGGLEYDRESAFWRFRTLTDLAMTDFGRYGRMVEEAWRDLESEISAAKAAVETEAARLYEKDPDAAARMLTASANAWDALAYGKAEELEVRLHTRIAADQYLYFAKPGLEW